MKMTFHQYRIILEVFTSFGIFITGHKKHKSFNYDFKVSNLYVKALIYELEIRLGMYLEDEALDGYSSPHMIVAAFKEYNKVRLAPITLFREANSGEPVLSKI